MCRVTLSPTLYVTLISRRSLDQPDGGDSDALKSNVSSVIGLAKHYLEDDFSASLLYVAKCENREGFVAKVQGHAKKLWEQVKATTILTPEQKQVLQLQLNYIYIYLFLHLSIVDCR